MLGILVLTLWFTSSLSKEELMVGDKGLEKWNLEPWKPTELLITY